MAVIGIGIRVASLRQPFKQALHTAARLGATAVEIDARGEIQPRDLSDTGLRQFRKMLEDLNLRVAAVSYPTRRGYNVAEELDRRVAGTKEAMQFAYRIGAPVVTNAVGRVPQAAEGPEWDLLVAALTDLARFGDHAGSRLAARTGSESGETLAKLLAAVPEGMIAVDLDPGGLVVNGFSAEEATATLAAQVAHVHARDAVRDLSVGRGLEVPLGRGSVDFPCVLGRLEEAGYRGFVTVERTAADDPTREIGDAVQYLRNLWS